MPKDVPNVNDKEVNKTDDKSKQEKLPYKDFHEKSFKDIAAQSKPDTEEPKADKPEDKEESKPDVNEAELEEKKKEIKEKRQEAKKVQLEERVKEATKQAIDEARKAEAEAVKKQEETEAKQKELDQKKSYTPKWKAENRVPKTWEELHEEAVNEALSKFHAELEEKEMKQAEETKQKQAQESVQKEQETKRNQEMEKNIETELADLYTNGKLPTVKKADDPNDEGILAKKALFETGVKVNTDRIARGLPPITSIKLIFYEHYKQADKQPPGATAPISGNSQASQNNEQKIKYPEIHTKSFRQILLEGLQRSKSQ